MKKETIPLNLTDDLTQMPRYKAEWDGRGSNQPKARNEMIKVIHTHGTARQGAAWLGAAWQGGRKPIEKVNK